MAIEIVSWLISHESDVAGLELMIAMDLQSGPLLTGQWTLTLANLSQKKTVKM